MNISLIDYGKIEKAVFASLITYFEDIEEGLDTYEKIDESDYYHAYRSVGSYESILEHISFSFYIEGISRACSHQLVRHRIASYTQRSQRHRKDKDFGYVIPDSIWGNVDAMEMYAKMMNEINECYQELMDFGVPNEDARYVLPNASCTDIMVTMNVRELRSFFKARCCQKAQWEIRQMAEYMLDICRDIYPELFVKCKGYCDGNDCPYGINCQGEMI